MSEVNSFYAADDFTGELCVLLSDFDAQRLRADTAESALEVAQWEVKCRIGAEVNAVEALAAAEQRISELVTALRRAKLWVEDRRRFGDYGTIAEDWLMIERTLREIPHPPSEFDAALNPNPEAESQ